MKAKKGNIGKHNAYALAFAMIDEAIEARCPIQAIAIEESILTDRLWSTLNVGVTDISEKQFNNLSLGVALKAWHPDAKIPEGKRNVNRKRFDAEMEELYPDLDKWREMRNGVIHSIAKSRQGKAPSIPAEKFREYAQEAATVGLLLARKVTNWTQKTVRKAKRTEKKSEMKGAQR